MLKIYKASAGSGKTFTLAKEYVKLLLGWKDERGQYHLRGADDYGFGKPKAQGEILAVTFTNKATEEMTARIVRELAILAYPLRFSDEKSKYLEDYMAEFRADEGAIVEASKRALDDLLLNFNSFNVSTLDSFFQMVLRTFARELNLPDDFDLELDDRNTVTLAVSEVMQSVNVPSDRLTEAEKKRKAHLMEWLERYMMQKVDGGQTFNIFSKTSSPHQSIIQLIRALTNEKFKEIAPEIDKYFSDPERLVRFEQGMKTSLDGLTDDLAREAGELLDSTPDGVFSKNFINILSNCVEKKFPDKVGSTAKNCAENPVKAILAPALRKGLADEALLGRVGTLAKRYCDLYASRALAKVVSAHIYEMGIFGLTLVAMREYCNTNNLFLLSDTNDLLRQIINEEEAPFIYERIGSDIKHYLVDEFQDTSKMQWENLQPLFMESLSHRHDNLVIGDEKQSIYRFRNSMPELLGSEVERSIKERYEASEVDIRGNRLKENCNHRSSKEIVMFNNSLFHALPKVADTAADNPATRIADTYANVVQSIPDDHYDFHGYVKMYYVPISGEEGEEVGEDYALSRMVEEISRQLLSGYRPADIAILVRRHSEGQKAIERLLAAMESPDWPHGQVRILSANAISVGPSSTIRLVISILRLLITPQYIPSLRPNESEPVEVLNPAFVRARLLNRYQVHSYDTVEGVDAEGRTVSRRVSPSEALARALDDDISDDEMRRHIDELLDMDCPNLISIVERIIARYVPDEAKAHDMAFLAAFMDLVVDYSERSDVSISTFLDWWDRTGQHAGIPAPAGSDAITVSTIHQSKGLQYGCVHLPFASSALVKYHSRYLTSYGWYPLSASDFPSVDPADIPAFIPLPNEPNLKEIAPFKESITEFAQQQRSESLNTAYVAFTRAVNELIVYTIPVATSRRDEGTNHLGTYIAQAVRKMTADFIASDETLTDERRAYVHPLDAVEPVEGNIAEFGSPTTKEEKKKDEKKKKKPKPDDVADTDPYYDEKLLDYKAYDSEVLTLSKADIRRTTLNMADMRDRGTFLHAVLSGVRTASDLDTAFARTAYRYRLSAEEKRENLALLRKALADKRVKPWFEGFRSVATERSLVFPDGKRRPDRVVWQTDGTVAVIDYKFGHPSEDYFGQVEEYVSLLRGTAAVGGAAVRGYIWYPTTGQIDRLPSL